MTQQQNPSAQVQALEPLIGTPRPVAPRAPSPTNGNLTRTGRPLRQARASVMIATGLVWVAAAVLTLQMGLYLSEPGATLGPDTPLGWANRAHVLACLLVFAIFGHGARHPEKS